MDIFWAKMGKKYFSQNFHWANIVIDHKCSFYKKNQQNPMTGFEEIDQNVRFWAKKRDFFWKKRKCHFRKLIMPQLCARNQNKPMNGF